MKIPEATLVDGERRLPARRSRQLAEMHSSAHDGENLAVRRAVLPASCRQLQAGSLRSPDKKIASMITSMKR